MRQRLDQIRTRVDGIDSFPEAAEEPVVTRADVRFGVIDVAVAGDVDEWTNRFGTLPVDLDPDIRTCADQPGFSVD